ncbi:MAG: tRNA (5-methylaminomethyl-2-thiouridine)(34)-methyltransferase MnmD [Bacteroidales bacterium]|nr:tRNA (5-methylaminomethyl-2-thiouridine)(34)-methyltransferase MnmD [Bacteroidales bacterium]
MSKIITTSDGSHTIYVPELNEHYHSIHGAVQESNFIFINSGYDKCEASPLRIFEAGFGTGLNALLTALKCNNENRQVYYTSIEKFPLEENIVRALNHHSFAGESGKELFEQIHSSSWDEWVKISKNFNLRKIQGDLLNCPLTGKYDLIYFDAFGPDKQPEMWTVDVFSAIASMTEKNGILVTYSAKGEVKRNLKASGFEVTLLPGPPGKRQIIRAVKI